MAIIVEAIYENGVLRLLEPVPLEGAQRVTVTIEPKKSWVDRTAGIMGWTGSAEDAEFLATDPDLEYPSPEDP